MPVDVALLMRPPTTNEDRAADCATCDVAGVIFQRPGTAPMSWPQYAISLSGSSMAFADLRSRILNPSANQPYAGASCQRDLADPLPKQKPSQVRHSRNGAFCFDLGRDRPLAHVTEN